MAKSRPSPELHQPSSLECLSELFKDKTFSATYYYQDAGHGYVGRGGEGTVRKVCRRDNPEKQYAAKIVNIDQGKVEKQVRCATEVYLLANLQHPHLVSFHEAFYNGKEVIMILEYCTPITTIIQDVCRKGLELSEVRAFGHQLLQALAYLHSRNVVHRDVKAANVLLASDGNIKLADFGISSIGPFLYKRGH
eukprot:Colp12_sorted_trinity150504_noHs@7975